MCHRAVFACLCWLLLTFAVGAPAQETAVADEYYFYHGRPYGSELMVGPLRLITNGGFGILQMENRDNQLDRIAWRNGWKNLWRNLGDPFTAISHKGWWNFARSEIIPISINEGDAQYWPNYMNHLIGGGMSYRLMREWYQRHGFEHDKALALSTITVYHFLNEVVEMHEKTGWAVDPVADMYLFNVAGIIAFSDDRISHFFGRTLNMRDWSSLPLYDPRRGTIQNQGQNFMVRWQFRSTSPWRLFYHWGNSGELGFSREIGGGNFLSAGAGWVAKNLRDVDGISETVNLATTFGMFWDREGSLLASVLYAREKDNRWRMNLYPGVIKVGPLRPGLSFISLRNKDFIAGVTLGSVPLWPVGFGTRMGNDR